MVLLQAKARREATAPKIFLGGGGAQVSILSLPGPARRAKLYARLAAAVHHAFTIKNQSGFVKNKKTLQF